MLSDSQKELCENLEAPSYTADDYMTMAEAANEIRYLAGQCATSTTEAASAGLSDETHRVADILFAAWSKAEPKHAITQWPESYKATFLDMARAILAARTPLPVEARAGEAPTNAEFETAIETLRNVIDCLRKNGSYTDEEGEATDFLEPLLEARLATPPASAAAAARAKPRVTQEMLDAQLDALEKLQESFERTVEREVRIRMADSQPARTEPTTSEVMLDQFRRIANELRTYNPPADPYNGEHTHKVWAREIDELLATRWESK